jgi:prepilin-type N-terminal cleavage/methylation domain-containing protein
MRPVDRRRGGFTLVELLVTVAIVGILAGLAIPNMRNVTFRARATAVFGDLNAIRQATLDYNADQSAWPPDESSGTVPAGLVPFLPDGFSFQGDGYELDFENQNLPSGLPGNPNVTRMVGAAITVPDAPLNNAIVEVLGGAIVFSIGNTHTVVFDAS